MFQFTATHFQRASNHNRTASAWRRRDTATHFQRASNHNRTHAHQRIAALQHTFKEHQITTRKRSRVSWRDCNTLSKSIKSQQYRYKPSMITDCNTLSKSIKSQLELSDPGQYVYCNTLSKSIKSQLSTFFYD